MAYNVSYSTLPTFTSSSIGHNVKTNSYNGGGNTWIVGNDIILDPGVYILVGNFTSNASYNTFSYIIVNYGTSNSDTKSIWFDSNTGLVNYSMSSFTTFQGSNPSTSGAWANYENWYPIAGSNYNAPTNQNYSRTTAISLSAILQISIPTTVNLLSYVSSTGSNYTQLSAIRIS